MALELSNLGLSSLKLISLSIDKELYPLEALTRNAKSPVLGKSSFIKSFRFGEGPCQDFGVTSLAGSAEFKIIPSSTTLYLLLWEPLIPIPILFFNDIKVSM